MGDSSYGIKQYKVSNLDWALEQILECSFDRYSLEHGPSNNVPCGPIYAWMDAFVMKNRVSPCIPVGTKLVANNNTREIKRHREHNHVLVTVLYANSIPAAPFEALHKIWIPQNYFLPATLVRNASADKIKD